MSALPRIPINAILTCVEYDDYLAITLPRNARHFDQVFVVTTPNDQKTIDLVCHTPNSICVTTTRFHKDGAEFNKGAGLNFGLQTMKELIPVTGWTCILDADTLLPGNASEFFNDAFLKTGNLYGAGRRMLPNFLIEQIEDLDFKLIPTHALHLHSGYFQLFHWQDPRCRNMPQYSEKSNHAGKADTFFMKGWPEHRRLWMPFDVVHLGPQDRNWFGRSSPRLDGLAVDMDRERFNKMTAFFSSSRWGRRRLALRDTANWEHK